MSLYNNNYYYFHSLKIDSISNYRVEIKKVTLGTGHLYKDYTVLNVLGSNNDRCAF